MRRMRAIAEAMGQRFEDEILLHRRDRAPYQIARGGLRSLDGSAGSVTRGADRRTVRRADSFGADFLAGSEQDGAMHSILKFAHIAWPGVCHNMLSPLLG